MTNKTYRTSALAEMFDVHQNTIRSYVDKIEDKLSANATANKRKYTYQDALIIYTVVKMRDIGIPFDDIVIAISEGKIEDSLPEVPSPEDEQARENVPIVHIPRDSYLIEQERLLNQITLIEQERDNALLQLQEAHEDRDIMQERVIQLERDLSSAKAQLDIIKKERPSAIFWLAVMLGVVIAVSFIIAGITLFFS